MHLAHVHNVTCNTAISSNLVRSVRTDYLLNREFIYCINVHPILDPDGVVLEKCLLQVFGVNVNGTAQTSPFNDSFSSIQLSNSSTCE